MSFDISGSLKVILNMVFGRTLALSTIEAPLNIYTTYSFSFGEAANQITQLYHDSVVLADGANTTLNLYDSGTLKDSFGNDVEISALKLLLVKNNSTDATLLLLGGNSADLPICSDPADQIKIPPGGTFIWTNMSAAGTDITTNKNLKLTHDGTGSSTMNVSVVVGGINEAIS